MCHTLTLQPIPQFLYVLSHCRICPYLLLCNLTLSPNHDACCQCLLVNINPTTIVKYCFHCSTLLFKIRLKNNEQYTMKVYHCGQFSCSFVPRRGMTVHLKILIVCL